MVIFSGLFTAFGRLMGVVATMTVVWATILLFGRVPQSVSRRLAFADAYVTMATESEQVEDRLSEIIRLPPVSARDFKPIDSLLTTLVVPNDDWETRYRLRSQVEYETGMPGATAPAGAS